jgi:hypothetical protein
VVECTRLESEQRVKALGSSNLPLSDVAASRPRDVDQKAVRAMNRRFFGTAALAAILAAAAAPASADMFARLDGRVTFVSSASGVPTIVTVTDGSGRSFDVSTDARGRFSALGLQPGYLTVSLNVDGLEPAQLTCDIPAGESGRFELGAYAVSKVPRIAQPVIADKQTSRIAYGCTTEPSTVDQYVIQ